MDVQAAIVLDAAPKWACASAALPVYAPHGSSAPRWLRNEVDVGDLCAALSAERDGALLIIVPASAPVDACSGARAAALDVARTLRLPECGRKVALVVDQADDAPALERSVLREWAALFAASQLRTAEWAAKHFQARKLAVTHTDARALWSGDLRISSAVRDRDPVQPSTAATVRGFRLVAPASAGDHVAKRIRALLPMSTRQVADVSAQLLTVVPRGQCIGGLLNARNELELHVTASCDATTTFFCDGLKRSGETLLMRIESLTFLCRYRNAGDAFICDVAPVYQLSTSMTRSLDMAWYRKYVLGICGRSQIHMPPPSVVNLPILGSKQQEPWIDKKKFGDAVAALTRVRQSKNDDKARPGRLREAPTSESRTIVERDALKRKEAVRADIARKRSRSGQLSLDSIVEPASSRPWTVRSSLSEDISTGQCSNREQISALRQNRQMRLQSMQSARALAARGAKGALVRRNSLRTTGRTRSALVARTPDVSVLRRLVRHENFYDYEAASAHLPKYRTGVGASNVCFPTHGVEYAPDKPDPRDACLVRYERDVGRTKQDHDTAWPMTIEGNAKLQAATKALHGEAHAELLKCESSLVGDTDLSGAGEERVVDKGLQEEMRKLISERNRIDEQIRSLQVRLRDS